MCIRNGVPNSEAASSMIQHPIRRTRTKTRKPKFLSLRLELISPENPLSPMSPKPTQQQQQQQQLNLFPLHPENLVEDRDCIHDAENVAFLFNDTSCSLQSFLPNQNAAVSLSSEDSLTFGRSSEADASSLVRSAMRSRERDAIGEKWVCYSEVVEKKQQQQPPAEELEVTSSAADEWLKKKQSRRQLSLKLDYQGILKAWSDKAPLYIKGGETPQTVPQLQEDQTPQSDCVANMSMDRWGSEGSVWKVPEMVGVGKEDIMEAKEEWKMAQREASVLRYKEKRQNRLFSKKIRYEVRKLNAEKRPRMKGRFVKRS